MRSHRTYAAPPQHRPSSPSCHHDGTESVCAWLEVPAQCGRVLVKFEMLSGQACIEGGQVMKSTRTTWLKLSSLYIHSTLQAALS